MKLLRLAPENTKISFMRFRRISYPLSAVLSILAVVLFLGVGIRLVDFKIECGRLWEGDNMRIVVADEISPDSCRLWDIKTNDKMDKDRFRKDLGGMIEAYTEVARRLGVMQENETLRTGTPKLVK